MTRDELIYTIYENVEEWLDPKDIALVIDALDALNQGPKRVAELEAALREAETAMCHYHETDFDQIVADGGVTAGMVIRKELGWRAERARAALKGQSNER
jgi:hypothetical protein